MCVLRHSLFVISKAGQYKRPCMRYTWNRGKTIQLAGIEVEENRLLGRPRLR
jgi:hypothetical protein